MTLDKKLSSKLILFTAQEIAETLKMNPQVILRKLGAGEIPGYKLGKEWRVSEEQLLTYLEDNSNAKSKQSKTEKIINHFFINNKLREIPATRSKRLVVLKYLVSMLENRIYDEKELNNFISKYHQDVCTIRREFICNKLIVRKNGKYKTMTWNT